MVCSKVSGSDISLYLVECQLSLLSGVGGKLSERVSLPLFNILDKSVNLMTTSLNEGLSKGRN